MKKRSRRKKAQSLMIKPVRALIAVTLLGLVVSLLLFNFKKDDVDVEGLSLSFVPNVGQTDSKVQFQTHGKGGTLFFTLDEVVLSLDSPTNNTEPLAIGDIDGRVLAASSDQEEDASLTVVRLGFEGASPSSEITGGEKLTGIVNYFIGNDPDRWHTNIPTYQGITYNNLYQGIDLYYDGTVGTLKGTYTIDGGVDPSVIRWRYEGAESVSLDKETGNLLIKTTDDEQTIVEKAPIAWQEVKERKVTVSASYNIIDDGTVGFALGDYDSSLPLTIDPILEYSTYLGGGGFDFAQGIAVDSLGNAYVTGRTVSADFPTANALQINLGGISDAFVSKLDSTGSSFIYSTYLGGSIGSERGSEIGRDIAVDSSGNAFITRVTGSSDFPTMNPAQAANRGNLNAFITKLNSTGSSLIYSTYLGGSSSESGSSIGLDSNGNVYVGGVTTSFDFPTINAVQGSPGSPQDGFITKLNPTGSTFLYSTFFGGSRNEGVADIAVDSLGNAYITGATSSGDFPTVNPFQLANGNIASYQDAFVAKLNSAGSAIIYSTYLGGNRQDSGSGIAVDESENVYITGRTESFDFPVANALQSTCPPLSRGLCSDAFVTKFNSNGSALIYSTYLGGTGSEFGRSVEVDIDNNAYISGQTDSNDFPLVDSIQPFRGIPERSTDIFITKLDSLGSSILFSSYLGGTKSDTGHDVAIDDSGNIYIAGITTSSNFPVVNALQPIFGDGVADAFVAKINPAVDNTPTGTNVIVSIDAVDITFPQVNLSGNTIVTTSSSGTQPPAGFKLGSPATYYNISTTATFSGLVKVCVNYDETAVQGNENNLKLMHFATGQGWIDTTTSLDTINNVICGEVSSFSEFSVMTEETIEGLIERIKEMDLQRGIAKSLIVKLNVATKAVELDRNVSIRVAVNMLNAFINDIEAQRGKKLTDDQANELRTFTENIIASLIN